MTQKPPQIKPCKKLLVKPTLSSCLIALSLGPGANPKRTFLTKCLVQLCSLVYLCGHIFIDPRLENLPQCLYPIFSNYLNWCKTRPMTGTEHRNWIRDPTKDL